jgi:hypothetical protein
MTTRTDDARVNAALTDLRAWSEGLPAYDVEAGAARHVELLGRAATPVGATAVVRGSRRAWWMIGGSAVLAVAVVSAWPRAPTAPPAERAFAAAPRLSAPDVSADPVAVAAPIEDAIIADPGSDEIAAPAVAPTRRPTSPRAAPAALPVAATTDVADPPDALERELAIVRRMRRALADDPRRVLQLATEADREVGRGVFTEERAALRVFALARLDDTATDAAAAAFLREFGTGPFAARVARLAGDEARPAEAQ